MIRTSYDPGADVLRIKFGPDGAKHDGADEVAPASSSNSIRTATQSALRS